MRLAQRQGPSSTSMAKLSTTVATYFRALRTFQPSSTSYLHPFHCPVDIHFIPFHIPAPHYRRGLLFLSLSSFVHYEIISMEYFDGLDAGPEHGSGNTYSASQIGIFKVWESQFVFYHVVRRHFSSRRVLIAAGSPKARTHIFKRRKTWYWLPPSMNRRTSLLNTPRTMTSTPRRNQSRISKNYLNGVWS